VVDPIVPIETAVTVLEVRRGAEVQSLFETWCLNNLHEQQEVVAVRLRVEYLSGPANEMMDFSWLDFQATYLGGSALDSFGSFCWEGSETEFGFKSYPPDAGEGWLAWKIRKGGELPCLLYQYGLPAVVDLGGILDPLILLLE